MPEERMNMSPRVSDRLKVVHAVEEGHLKQIEAAQRLRLSARQVRRLQRRVRTEGDRGLVHWLECHDLLRDARSNFSNVGYLVMNSCDVLDE